MQDIIETIKQLHTDLKAEVVVSSFQEAGISEDRICIKNESVFHRSFRKDVISAKQIELKNFDEVVEITLSRDSLYDLLPEGIFHQSHKDSSSQVTKMVAEHKRFKREEQSARQFFVPFENEFFHHRVEIEKQEKKFYQKVNGEKNEILKHFWKLDPNLPNDGAKQLIEFLPQANAICSSLKLMEETLSKIISEEVKVTLLESDNKYHVESTSSINDMLLGVNSLSGNQFSEFLPSLEFKIGPLKSNSIEQYLTNQPYNKLLNRFFDYFTPLEAEIKITFAIDKKSNSENASINILGYNFEL
ncbi:MAG TPA: hypothetical protein PLU17_06530 [Chitinophagaceae bacterium]|nr:hypothetical protein [Chitinophagaceae bacterium]